MSTSKKTKREQLPPAQTRFVDFLFSKPIIQDVEHLRRKLSLLVLIRVIILSGTLGLNTWSLLTHGNLTEQAFVSFLSIAMLYGISLINVIWLRITSHIGTFGYGQLIVDVVLATLAIHITQSPASIALYLLVIIGAAALFSSHGAVIVAVCSALCYATLALGILPSVSGIETNATPQDILMVYTSLVVIALVSGYLAQQLEHMGELVSRRERDLNEFTRHQRKLFNDISEGVITLNTENHITSINAAAQSILEIDDTTETHFPTFLEELGVEEPETLLQQALTRGTSEELELSSKKSQEEIHIRYTIRQVTNMDSHHTGNVFFFNDITHVRSIQEQLSLHERMTKLLADQGSKKHSRTLDHKDGSRMIGESPVMRQVLSLIARVSSTNASVLIAGESGTGKELIARAIHESGTRSSKPFVAINCGAIPENLIESELFGHKKGAFTGAVNDNVGLFRKANGGTVFLDEIGELPLQLQSKLLRVLQDKTVRAVGDTQSIPVDIRIVAATNRDLKQEISRQQFREDLYYRLNVVNILLPPLRERKEDIPLLVQHFIGQHADSDLPIPQISPEALRFLLAHSFPGNIRELENIIERALVLGGTAILPEHLPAELLQSESSLKEEQQEEREETQILLLPISLEGELEKIEKDLLCRALEQAQGVKKQAATLLGLNFRSFRYRLKKYGLSEGSDIGEE